MAVDGPGIPAPPARERRFLPPLAVLVVLIAVVFGGYVTAGALSSPTGAPLDVAGIVRVTPLAGWELAARFTEPPGARLTRGSGNLDVAAAPFAGVSEDLVREYVSGALEPQAEQLSVSRIEPVRLASGLSGARASYVGTFAGVQVPIEGAVTAVVSDAGAGVIFDGWAPSGQLQHVLEDIETMIARAEVA